MRCEVSLYRASGNINSTVAKSHSRLWEIGTLYTAVAGMLNLLAIIDSSHRAAINLATSRSCGCRAA